MIEARFGLSVRVEGEPSLISPDYRVERFKTASRIIPMPEALNCRRSPTPSGGRGGGGGRRGGGGDRRRAPPPRRARQAHRQAQAPPPSPRRQGARAERRARRPRSRRDRRRSPPRPGRQGEAAESPWRPKPRSAPEPAALARRPRAQPARGTPRSARAGRAGGRGGGRLALRRGDRPRRGAGLQIVEVPETGAPQRRSPRARAQAGDRGARRGVSAAVGAPPRAAERAEPDGDVATDVAERRRRPAPLRQPSAGATEAERPEPPSRSRRSPRRPERRPRRTGAQAPRLVVARLQRLLRPGANSGCDRSARPRGRRCAVRRPRPSARAGDALGDVRRRAGIGEPQRPRAAPRVEVEPRRHRHPRLAQDPRRRAPGCRRSVSLTSA